MPASHIALNMSTDEDAGPIVQTIFVRLKARSDGVLSLISLKLSGVPGPVKCLLRAMPLPQLRGLSGQLAQRFRYLQDRAVRVERITRRDPLARSKGAGGRLGE